MSYRNKFITTALVLVVAAVGLIFYSRADYVGICDQVDKVRTCINRVDDVVSILFGGLVIFAPLLFIFGFLHKEVFTVWRKFARIYIPISLILVAVTPSSSGGSMFIGLGEPDKGSVGWLLGVVFVIVSLILIIRTHRRLKRQAKVMPTSFPTGGQKSI